MLLAEEVCSSLLRVPETIRFDPEVQQWRRYKGSSRQPFSNAARYSLAMLPRNAFPDSVRHASLACRVLRQI